MEADTPNTAAKAPSIEIYSEKRIEEFDAAEVELAEFLCREK